LSLLNARISATAHRMDARRAVFGSADVQKTTIKIDLIVSVVLRPQHFRLAPADRRTAAARRFGSSGALRRSS
jgi:hypothetical protein